MKTTWLIAALAATLPLPSIAFDVFDPEVCASGQEVDRATATRFIGAGESERSMGRAKIYRRSRKCNVATGCGQWQPAVEFAKMDALMLTKGSAFAVRFTIDGDPLELGWLSADARGAVNGFRWWDNPIGDVGGTLYLREHCAKLHLTLAEDLPTDEFAAYWSY